MGLSPALFPKLSNRNHQQWRLNMEARLRTLGAMRIVQGTESRLHFTEPLDSRERRELRNYNSRVAAAAGEIWNCNTVVVVSKAGWKITRFCIPPGTPSSPSLPSLLNELSAEWELKPATVVWVTISNSSEQRHSGRRGNQSMIQSKGSSSAETGRLADCSNVGKLPKADHMLLQVWVQLITSASPAGLLMSNNTVYFVEAQGGNLIIDGHYYRVPAQPTDAPLWPLDTFHLMLQLVFKATFDCNECKVTYTLSYLKGTALQWFEPYLLEGYSKEPSLFLYSYKAFQDEL
ncbi:hypothetical protein ACG7TL_007652 [Trametes sanguinea]